MYYDPDSHRPSLVDLDPIGIGLAVIAFIVSRPADHPDMQIPFPKEVVLNQNKSHEKGILIFKLIVWTIFKQNRYFEKS